MTSRKPFGRGRRTIRNFVKLSCGRPSSASFNGDLATGKAVLRDYVNATVGFQDLEKRTHIPAKSLMRMLGPKGSPSAQNLFTIVSVLQRTEGIRFSVQNAALS